MLDEFECGSKSWNQSQNRSSERYILQPKQSLNQALQMLLLVCIIIWGKNMDPESYFHNQLKLKKMWIYHRMLDIPWIKNKWVLQELNNDWNLTQKEVIMAYNLVLNQKSVKLRYVKINVKMKMISLILISYI